MRINNIVRIVMMLAILMGNFGFTSPAYACGDESSQQQCEPHPNGNVEVEKDDNDRDNVNDTLPVCKIGNPSIDGLTVYITSDSIDPDGGNLKYYWYFHVGAYTEYAEALTNPASYTYNNEGNYTIKLVVYDDEGNSAECQRDISILVRTVHDPVCSFEYEELEDGLFVFNSTSTDADGQVEGYTWQIDQGEVFYGISNSVKLEPGTHQVTHAVSDNEYNGATCSREVTYTPQPEPDNESKASCDQRVDVGDSSDNNVQICGDNNNVTIEDDELVAQMQYLTEQTAYLRQELELQTGAIAELQYQLSEHDAKESLEHEALAKNDQAIYDLLWQLLKFARKFCKAYGFCRITLGRG